MQLLLKATNPPFSDCVLISNSGERYCTYKGLLVMQSNVFKDMFESCDKPASSAPTEPFDLQLPDASALVEAITAYIQNPDIFWSTMQRTEAKELLEVLGTLVAFAHKYHMQGAIPSVRQYLCKGFVKVYGTS